MKRNLMVNKKGILRTPLIIYCKPVSRILYPDIIGRLSFIWLLHYCNNLAAYPSAWTSSSFPVQNRSADIRGIAAHKVYPPDLLPHRTW